MLADKSRAAILMAVALVALFLTACGGTTGGSTGVTPTVTPTITPTPAPTIESQGETTLTGHCQGGDFPAFDLEAGSTTGTADIIWGDSCLSPAGAYQVHPQPSNSSSIAQIAASGETQAQFDAITLAQLQALTYIDTEFPATTGTTFAVHTHGGHYAKVFVEAVNAFLPPGDTNTYQFRYVTYA